MSLLNNDMGLAALLSKVITGPRPPAYDHSGNRAPEAPNTNELRKTAEQTSRNMADNQTVMQTLPDIELSIQILVSSVLSPKDMMTTELTYMPPDGLLPPDVAGSMTTRLKEHFEHDYKIKPLLPVMLRDILAEKGSYVAAVIPENSIDDVINNSRKISLESLSEHLNGDGTMRSWGLLGPTNKPTPSKQQTNPGLSMEWFNTDISTDQVDPRITLEADFKTPVETFLTVTDNAGILKLPEISHRIREQRITNAIKSKALNSLSMEHVSMLATESVKLNDRELTGLLFKDKQYSYTPITAMKTQEQLARRTVGNPLILHLPSDSVIPVYVPGSTDKQIGFFVLLDADGNPLTSNPDVDHYRKLSDRMSGGGNFASAMLNKVSDNMNGFNCANRESLDYSARVYGNMVEQDLLARLRNGAYGNGVAIAKKEEVYRMMFARALAKQHTQMLFMPIELVTYFAFRFSPDGIGKSLLDDMKILSGLRAMVMFANVMAGVKNSIGRTKVVLKVDEDDPDPLKTLERMKHDFLRNRSSNFPIGTNNPSDINDFLVAANIEFTHEGHPGLPDVSVDVSESNSNYTKPDTEMEESLRKQSIMAMGLPPATVDASYEADLATSVVTNNILLSKRVMQIQEMFLPLLNDHLRKVAMNSETLLTDLRKILEDNYEKLAKRMLKKMGQSINGDPKNTANLSKEYVIQQTLHDFIMRFEVSLPRPNSVTLENQMDALEKFTKALDAGLDAYISTNFLTSATMGDMQEHVDNLKEVIKAYYIRRWMAENGCLPELAELTTTDEEGKPVVDIYKAQVDHIAAITKSLTFFMEGITPVKQAANVVNEKLNDNDTTESSSTPTSSDSGGDDTGSGGSDDFGFGMPNMDVEETPAQTPEDGNGDDTDPDADSEEPPGGDSEQPAEGDPA